MDYFPPSFTLTFSLKALERMILPRNTPVKKGIFPGKVMDNNLARWAFQNTQRFTSRHSGRVFRKQKELGSVQSPGQPAQYSGRKTRALHPIGNHSLNGWSAALNGALLPFPLLNIRSLDFRRGKGSGDG